MFSENKYFYEKNDLAGRVIEDDIQPLWALGS